MAAAHAVGPVAGDLLRPGGLSGVTLYEPGALTLVVGAGTPLTKSKRFWPRGQRLAFEPMDHRGFWERAVVHNRWSCRGQCFRATADSGGGVPGFTAGCAVC